MNTSNTSDNEKEVRPDLEAEGGGNAPDTTHERQEAEHSSEAEDRSGEAEEGAVSAEEVARLVAEAEQRGYLRGLNENAREMMGRPALLENPRVRTAPEKDRDACQTFASRFLTRLPRGVWD